MPLAGAGPWQMTTTQNERVSSQGRRSSMVYVAASWPFLLQAKMRAVGRLQAISLPPDVHVNVHRSLGRVAEWQTRWLQVPVSFGTWGFKSPSAHNTGRS